MSLDRAVNLQSSTQGMSNFDYRSACCRWERSSSLKGLSLGCVIDEGIDAFSWLWLLHQSSPLKVRSLYEQALVKQVWLLWCVASCYVFASVISSR